MKDREEVEIEKAATTTTTTGYDTLRHPVYYTVSDATDKLHKHVQQKNAMNTKCKLSQISKRSQ